MNSLFEKFKFNSSIKKLKESYLLEPSSIGTKEKQLIAKKFSDCSRKEWLKYYKPFRQPPFNLEIRTRNLLDVSQILEEVGLKFWLTNGTALCAYRDKDWIPWDDDIDLDTMMEDFLPKYDLIKKLLIKKEFLVRSTRIRNPRYAKLAAFRGETPFGGEKVAIRPLYLDSNYKNNIYRLRHDYKYPRIYYECKKQTKVFFKGHYFNIPSPPEKFLEYAYGKNWRTPLKNDLETEYSPLWIKRKFKKDPPITLFKDID
tara:strand:- start:26 stop:796 length:771 start_codon:yes stop_codon:yes gene_type:complete